MSRLHECKAKGLGSVESEPHWAGLYPTLEDRANALYLKAVVSGRAGTRDKTKRKTAQALGHDYRDVRPWKIRHSDIASAKSQKVKGLKKATKVAAETARGDAKKA